MSRRGLAAVHPSPSEIREIGGIRRVLRKRGVASSERSDVAQDLVLVPGSAIQAGKFRQDPTEASRIAGHSTTARHRFAERARRSACLGQEARS